MAQSPAQPLSRSQVWAILSGSGILVGGRQVRPLNRNDIQALMFQNGQQLGGIPPTGDGLPLENLDFREADLRRLDLTHCNFEGSDCSGADFTDSDLRSSRFKGTDLRNTLIVNTRLANSNLDTLRLEGIRWYIKFVSPEENDGDLTTAEQLYRSLKRSHQAAGIYDVADQFAYREQISITKQQWRSRNVTDKLKAFVKFIFVDQILGYGYGYRPWRVWRSGMALFVTFTLVFWLTNLYGSRGALEFGESAYFSAVSFTAVGYGAWVSGNGVELSWSKYLGAAEALIGVFLMALFLVTFSRQWFR